MIAFMCVPGLGNETFIWVRVTLMACDTDTTCLCGNELCAVFLSHGRVFALIFSPVEIRSRGRRHGRDGAQRYNKARVSGPITFGSSRMIGGGQGDPASEDHITKRLSPRGLVKK